MESVKKTARQLAFEAFTSAEGLVESYRGFAVTLKLDAASRSIDVCLTLFGRKIFDELIPEAALESLVLSLLSLTFGAHAQELSTALDLAVSLFNEWAAANPKVIVPPVADPAKT